MNSFILKIIACFTMFIDHLKYIIPGKPIFMGAIGRLAFPIFAFQAVEGYTHTRNVKKYLLRLLIFALISQIPYNLYFNTNTLNILFTLFLGILSISIYEYFKNIKIFSFTSILLIMAFAEIIQVDYGFYGIGIMLIFHILKNKKVWMTLSFILLTILFFVLQTKIYLLDANIINYLLTSHFLLLLICTLLGIIPCLLYNGKQGPKMKYFFYFFYPLHIIVLLLLQYFI